MSHVMKEPWFEVWIDDSITPPYVLLVGLDSKQLDSVMVYDPNKNYSVIHQGENYEETRLWLLEDEYTRVEGRI